MPEANDLIDFRYFDAKFLLPASPQRDYLSCPTRRRLVSINATTGKVVAESAIFQADTGAIVVAPYNTGTDAGTMWVSLTDGTSWRIPLTSSTFGTPAQVGTGTHARPEWISLIAAADTTWVVVPTGASGLVLIDSAGIRPSKVYDGMAAGNAFGLSFGLDLYVFDGKSGGCYFTYDTVLGLVKQSSFSLPNMTNIVDGVALTISSLLVGFVLASAARDRVVVYTTVDPNTPVETSDAPYDTNGLTVTGTLNSQLNVPITREEYPTLGFPVWHALTAGRDNLAGNRVAITGTSSRLEIIVPSPVAPIVEAFRIIDDGTLRSTDDDLLRLVVS